MMRRNKQKKNEQSGKISRRRRRVLVSALCVAVLLSTVHSLVLPALTLTKDQESGVVQGTEESAVNTNDSQRSGAAEETGDSKTVQNSAQEVSDSDSPTAVMKDDTEITATIYKDGTYSKKKEDDQTTIRIKGSLPVDSTTGEAAVEAKAFPTDLHNVTLPDNAQSILTYDIKLFYKEADQSSDGGNEFEPAKDSPLTVTLESSELHQALADNEFYAVYYVPDQDDESLTDSQKMPELVAAESASVQAQKAESEENKDQTYIEGKEKAEKAVRDLQENSLSVTDTVKEVLNSGTDDLVKGLSDKTAEKAQENGQKQDGVAEVISRYDAASAVQGETSASSAESDAAESGAAEASSGTDLVVEQEKNQTAVTFQANHFSVYTIASQPASTGDNISDVINYVKLNVYDGTKKVSYSDGETADAQLGLYHNYAVSVDMGTKDIKLFYSKVKVGDYFDLMLPNQFDYSAYGTQTFHYGDVSTTGIEGTGQLWGDSEAPMLRITVTKLSQANLFAPGNGAFFSAGFQAPFNEEYVNTSDSESTVNQISAGSALVKTDGSVKTVQSATTSILLAPVTRRTEGTPYPLSNAKVDSVVMSYAGTTMSSADSFVTNRSYGITLNWSWNTWLSDYLQSNPTLQAGDYFTIQLPQLDGASYTLNTSLMTLKNSDGVAIAQATMEGNNVKITFLDNLDSSLYSEASGSVFLTVVFENTGTYEITADVSENEHDQAATSGALTVQENGSPDDSYYNQSYYYQVSNFSLTGNLSGMSLSQTRAMLFALFKDGTPSSISDLYKNNDWQALAQTDENTVGADDYVVAYCGQYDSNAETSGFEGYAYQRMTLDQYAATKGYSDATKEKIRYIISHAYPFVSKADMISTFGLPSDTTKDECIAAAQFAVWVTLIRDQNSRVSISAEDILGSRSGTNIQSSVNQIRPLSDDELVWKYSTVNGSVEEVTEYNNYLAVLQGAENAVNNGTASSTPAVSIEKATVNYMKVASGDEESGLVQIFLSRELEEGETAEITVSDGNGHKQQIVVKGENHPGNPISVLLPGASSGSTVTVSLDVTGAETAPEVYYYVNSSRQDFISAVKSDRTLHDEATAVEDEVDTDVTVRKEWSDGADQHKDDSVTVHLYSNYNSEDQQPFNDLSAVLSAENNWETTFSSLPKYRIYKTEDSDYTSEAVTYTIKEDSVDGYTATYSSESSEGVKDWSVPENTEKYKENGKYLYLHQIGNDWYAFTTDTARPGSDSYVRLIKVDYDATNHTIHATKAELTQLLWTLDKIKWGILDYAEKMRSYADPSVEIRTYSNKDSTTNQTRISLDLSGTTSSARFLKVIPGGSGELSTVYDSMYNTKDSSFHFAVLKLADDIDSVTDETSTETITVTNTKKPETPTKTLTLEKKAESGIYTDNLFGFTATFKNLSSLQFLVTDQKNLPVTTVNMGRSEFYADEVSSADGLYEISNSTLYIRLNIGYKVQFLNLPENYSYRITESSSGIGNNSGWRSPLISYQGGDAKLSGFGDSIFTIEGENDQDDVTVTYTNRSLARINLYKVREGTDASNAGPGQYLAGAEFKLYQWNGETNEEDKIYVEVPLSSSSAYQKRDDSDGDPARITESGEEPVSAVTDQNTILIGEHGVTIYGLVPGGEYKLVEVKIPDGYVAREDTYFKVFYGPKSNSFGMTENWTSLDGVQGDAFKIDNEKNCRPGLWIVNPIGKGLPDTGGRGTTAIYLAGLLLIAGALLGWLRVARKRR